MVKVNGEYLIKPACIIIGSIIFFCIMVVAITGMVQIYQTEKDLKQMVKTTKLHDQNIEDLKKLHKLHKLQQQQ